MATFTGTQKEFKRYIGPRLRNLVQMITKTHKAAVGACEYCGVSNNLESAHVHGRDRNQIIDLLLAKDSPAHLVTVDLELFEEGFRREHNPVEKAILILCHQCHTKYDSVVGSLLPEGSAEKTNARQTSAAETLPITLEPPQSAEFKRQILLHRRAEIVVYYCDGRIEHRPWEAPKLSEKSNIMGNLRSRQEFKQGKWQAAGIIKVHACVLKSDAL